MSYADEVFIRNCRDILTHGVWDTDQAVRPHWEDDGAPAHTVKKFGIVNRYDLSKEFPLLTLRRTYWKTAVDELLWIWQQKSNNIHDLRGHIWDQWADETGSIGKRYRREDEIGTPYCITFDFDTVGDEANGIAADHCVTIRERDSMEQVRIPISEVKDFLREKIAF